MFPLLGRGHMCDLSGILRTFFIVSTGVVTWSALWCGACGESGKNVAAAPLSKTAAASAVAETWFAKLPLDYMLHCTFPWNRCGRRSAMGPPYSLWRNLSPAGCRPCDYSLKQNRIRIKMHTKCMYRRVVNTVPLENDHGIWKKNQMHKLVAHRPFLWELCQTVLRILADSDSLGVMKSKIKSPEH